MNPLSPKITCAFAGKFPGHTHGSLKKLIESYGADVRGSISGKVDYLVAGSKLSESKRQQAEQFGIPIVGFDEFLMLLEPEDAQSFWTSSELSGNEAPDQFADKIKGLGWTCFHPHEHGEKLRELLIKQDRLHGPHEAHFFCSERLKLDLTLIHPYGHDGPIVAHDVSPDGRWLATGSLCKESPERGSVLQIWEVTTGRVVNRLRVRGRIEEKSGMQWSPDGGLLAMVYDTNIASVWCPFSERGKPKAYAEVIAARVAPSFGWSDDSRHLFIGACIEQDWELPESENSVEERGCWIPIEGFGDMSDIAQPGYFSEGREPGLAVEQPAFYTRKPTPQVGKDFIIFPHLTNGRGRGEYYNRPPGFQNPLLSGQHDLGARFPIHPAFPIVHNGQEYWGVAFESGAVVAPSDCDLGVVLNFSLGRMWAWPMRWVDDLLQAESLPELAEFPPPKVPYTVQHYFKGRTAVKRVPQSIRWPNGKGKEHGDLVSLTVETLTQLSPNLHFFADEYLLQTSMTEILRGKYKSARDIADKISGELRNECMAELAFHCAARGALQEAELYLEKALMLLPEAQDGQLSRVHTFLAGCYYFLERDEEAEEQLSLALNHCLPEANPGENTWPLVGVLYAMERGGEAIQYMRAWELRHSMHFSENAVHNVLWYGSLEQLLSLKAFSDECELISEHDWVKFLTKKIVYDKSYDRIEDVFEAFDFPSYGEDAVARILDAMVKEGEDVRETLTIFLPKRIDGYKGHWNHWLNVASRHAPVLAHRSLDTREWELSDVRSWEHTLDNKFKVFFALGQSAARLQRIEDFERELTEISDGFQVAFLAGAASVSMPQEAEMLLDQAGFMLEGTELGRVHLLLWWKVVVASYTCGSKSFKKWLRKGLEATMEHGGDVEVAALATRLAKVGALEPAHFVWAKLPEGSRQHRITALLEGACQIENIDALYEALLLLDARELNDRAVKAVSVLSTLTRSRGWQLLG